MDWLKSRAPGLALAVLVAVPARLLAGFVPKAISEVLIALVLGAIVANTVGVPARAKPGVQAAVRLLLRAGIVLLGARLLLADVVAIGAPAAVVVIALMSGSLAAAVLLGRALSLPPRLCLLLGVGTSVCGNTAIASAAPILGAEEREVAFAVATITLFGTLATLVYPLIGQALALSPAMYGAWCGLAVNDTSQVVAAGAAGGPTALDVATIVKLTRNALMAPLLVGLALWAKRSAAGGEGRPTGPKALAKAVASAVPLFVVAFLGLSLLRTVGVIDAELAGIAEKGARALILAALAGVGLSTRFADLRATGLRPLLLGFVLSAALAVAALAAVTMLGFVPSA